MLAKAALFVVGLVALAVLTLWMGAAMSLDRSRAHTRATAELPDFEPVAGTEPALVQIPVGEQRFRARVAGFGGTRGNLILLHGFPETSAMWLPLIRAAAAAGYQVVAFDQRGYSPGARPEGAEHYALEALVSDVGGVADAVGFERFHLVGHDWGGVVGWAIAMQAPERLDSWSSLSVPHILAFADAVQNDPEQRSMSSYVLLFRTPWLPEQIFSFGNFRLLRGAIYADHTPDLVDEYLAVFGEPGALTAALHWYRAAFPSDPADLGLSPEIELPTLFVWGQRDPAVARAGMEGQRRFMKGPYEEVELDTGHWLMETAPDAVVPAVLRHIQGVN